jgi:pilus assembly protein CpaC
MRSDRTQRRPNIVICVAAALLAIAPASSARAAEGGDLLRVGGASDPAAQHLPLGVGQSVIVDLPEEAGEIYVGDPKIANAIVRSAKRIYISAVANGQTTIFALARDGRKIKTIEVSVGLIDFGGLSALLNAAIPGNDIHVRTVAGKIILTGSVESAEEAQKAIDIASGFVDAATAPSQSGPGGVSVSIGSGGNASNGSGGSASNGSHDKVINSLTIRGLDQVSLRVTVAEIRREILKQLGVNLSGSGPNGSFTLDNPFAINGTVATSQGILNWVKGGQNFSATLQAFERQGVAHTLAEPTVTAVSGESAKFLAGGTVPIVSGQSCSGGACSPTLVQQPYGVTLNFTPVVLSEGRIQLRIATEVTDIDYSTQISYAGISVPGFRTRSNTTTVELPSGGSVASAGLISTQTEQAINGFPALMNVPILGALFRSRDYQRNETELLITVTPYIVHPVDPNQIVQPDQNFQDASDPQTWFLGRVNRIYSASQSLEPMPGYSGKVGFITQ